MSITDVDGTVKEALDVHRRVGERAVVFFDAVMAIAITLLVLEIDIPNEGHFRSAQLQEMYIPFTALFVSFVALGQVWYLHTKIFSVPGMMREVSAPAHLVLMFLVVLFPKTTEIISEYPKSLFAAAIYLTCYTALIVVAFFTVRGSYKRASKRLGDWVERQLGCRPDKESLQRLREADEWYDKVLSSMRDVTRMFLLDVVLAVVTAFGMVLALLFCPIVCYVCFIIEMVGSKLLDRRAAGPWETVREAWAYLDEIDSGTVIVSNEAGDKDAAATPHDSQA